MSTRQEIENFTVESVEVDALFCDMPVSVLITSKRGDTIKLKAPRSELLLNYFPSRTLRQLKRLEGSKITALITTRSPMGFRADDYLECGAKRVHVALKSEPRAPIYPKVYLNGVRL